MLHMHNPSTLLGSHRKSVYYPPTGTGRDSYIMANNGGTNTYNRLQGVPQLGNYMKFGSYGRTYRLASSTQFQKYASDGTGRDQYVVSRHGGQFNQQDECKLKILKFRNTMRDGGATMCKTSRQGWRRKKVVAKDNILYRAQQHHNAVLSTPKRVAEKYSIHLAAMRSLVK